MLKHIFRNVNLKKLPSFRTDKKNFNINYPIIIKSQKLKPNLKVSNVFKNIHTSTANNGKLFYDYENNYAFSIINKESSSTSDLIGVKSPDSEVSTLEHLNATLDQNWRASSATEIVKAFKIVKDYCVQNEINVSDPRFDKLVNGLMDQCEKLTDTELFDLLSCLSEYPLCESYTSHNFHDIWSCLDDICCWKILEWDVEKMFKFANIWYKLNLGKLCDFVFVLIDRLTKKADQLTKDQLVNIFFYFNVCRKRAVDFEYEYALEKLVNQMNVDEIAVVALGYFKTRTKIKLNSILQTMVEKVMESSKTVHEIPLTAVLKILRMSKPIKIVPQIQALLDSLDGEIARLSDLCCLHIALMGTSVQVPHQKTLQKVTEKIVRDIKDIEKVRLKDIERFLHVLSMFDLDPKTEPDIYQAAYNELHKEERLEEFIRYPRCLPCALNYLSLRNIYSHTLLNKVLDIEYINETYGKSAKTLPRELCSLNASIDIEFSDYKGNRLPPELKYKAAKWLTEYMPSYDQYKKITAADQLILDTIDTVKVIIKDEKLMYIDHVLPHFSRADIILCKDKNSGQFVQPRGFENYTLGDVMFPINDGSLEWFAIVILGWNNTVRESSLPLGQMVMKRRQLEKVGYTPVFVIWNQFLKLSKEDRVGYILRKLS